MKKAIGGNLRQCRAVKGGNVIVASNFSWTINLIRPDKSGRYRKTNNVGQGFLQEPMVLSEPEVNLANSE